METTAVSIDQIVYVKEEQRLQSESLLPNESLLQRTLVSMENEQCKRYVSEYLYILLHNGNQVDILIYYTCTAEQSRFRFRIRTVRTIEGIITR